MQRRKRLGGVRRICASKERGGCGAPGVKEKGLNGGQKTRRSPAHGEQLSLHLRLWLINPNPRDALVSAFALRVYWDEARKGSACNNFDTEGAF